MIALPGNVVRRFQLLAVTIAYGEKITLGLGVHISNPSGIQLHNGGSLEVASGSTIEKDGILNIHGSCKIGKDVYISTRFLLGCSQSITIGDNVAIGPNVVIVDANKIYTNLSVPVSQQGGVSKDINIGADSWVGANSTILPGTTLGRHVVVGAGSVVRGSFPDNVLIGGSPAKIIRNLA